MRFVLLFMALLYAGYASTAPIETFKFDSRKNEQLFQKLSGELRCLVCQNEAIAESNADLAKDLRHQVYSMVRQGKSEDEVKAYMVQRYGDYVLFDPPFKPLTWLLWFGPALLFVIALYFVLKIIRRLANKTDPDELTATELERITQLHTDATSSVNKESKNL